MRCVMCSEFNKKMNQFFLHKIFNIVLTQSCMTHLYLVLLCKIRLSKKLCDITLSDVPLCVFPSTCLPFSL